VTLLFQLDFSLSLSLSLLNRYLINQSNCVGNSSQVSEGAGVVVLMKRSMALKKGLPILGVFRLPNLPYLD
jgi:hypothetical protein